MFNQSLMLALQPRIPVHFREIEGKRTIPFTEICSQIIITGQHLHFEEAKSVVDIPRFIHHCSDVLAFLVLGIFPNFNKVELHYYKNA